LRALLLLVACNSPFTARPNDMALPAGRCAQQDDCPDGTICQATPLGSPTGTCVPPSTLHCANCKSDADCGDSALCFLAPSDVAAYCHVDCSLSFLACPDGYNCSPVLYGDGGTRQLCLPIENRCDDATGSTCTPGQTQACMRQNSAGSCSGTRPCVDGQFGPCGAPEPTFLDHCGATPPAGCNELPSQAALSAPSDCGACGNACPPVNSASADAACVDPANKTCGISCRGDVYDVDGNINNGCEVADPEAGNHDKTTASPFPNTDCSDSNSQNTFTGHIVSDTRMHTNPAVTDFDATVGAAPHWYSVFSSGGLTCADDYALTLTTTGGPAVPCYMATIITDKNMASVTTTGAGTASTSGPAGAYSDNSTIYFKVEKTCSTMSVGGADVSYTVSYHL
jgi:hypothetical protein